MNLENNEDNSSCFNNLLEWITAADIYTFTKALSLSYATSFYVHSICLTLYNEQTDLHYYNKLFKSKLATTQNEEHVCWPTDIPSSTSPYIKIYTHDNPTYWNACVERRFIPSYAAELTFQNLIVAAFWMILLKNIILATYNFVQRIRSTANQNAGATQLTIFNRMRAVSKFALQHLLLALITKLFSQLYFAASEMEIYNDSPNSLTQTTFTTPPATPQML